MRWMVYVFCEIFVRLIGSELNWRTGDETGTPDLCVQSVNFLREFEKRQKKKKQLVLQVGIDIRIYVRKILFRKLFLHALFLI